MKFQELAPMIGHADYVRFYDRDVAIVGEFKHDVFMYLYMYKNFLDLDVLMVCSMIHKEHSYLCVTLDK